jgi:hypothetical protein
MRKMPTWLLLAASILVGVAVSIKNFGIRPIIAGGVELATSNTVESCDNPSVLQHILQDTFYKPRSQALSTQDYISAAGRLGDVRSLTAKLDTIRQLGYDKENNIRLCVANYHVNVDLAHNPQLRPPQMPPYNYSLTPAMISQMVAFIVAGWRTANIEFGMCEGTIYYRLEKVLDNPNTLVTWKCIAQD